MARRRLLAVLLAGSIVGEIVGGASADAAPAGGPARPASGPALEMVPGSGIQLREHASIGWHRAPPAAAAAWSAFRAEAVGWRASWDEATSVPSRMFGRGLPAPGVVADAAAAERHARRFLARHIDLLAPGASPSDFELASNLVRRGMRTVGFRQTFAGMPVLGGQVSFRYKNDRLFVVGSEALPHVSVSPPRAGLAAPAEAAAGFARSWILTDAAEATAGAVDGPFVLPLIGDGRVLGYRVVRRVDVSARAPLGLFWVYTDAATGAPIAREGRLHFADGEVLYDVPVRFPGGDRRAFPARAASITVDGASAVTTDEGLVTWSGSDPGVVSLRVSGPLVAVNNRDIGQEPASRDFVIEPGGSVTWEDADDELVEAQLNAFIHSHLVKEYARRMNPELPFLDQQLPVNVNIQNQCNAFSDGTSINFFQSSPECANTGQLADVVYHEFGHSLHAHSVIAGVGRFDGAHSEGLSDYLSATITGDPGMARGFFRSADPLRHIDPHDYENSWPRDVGEVHFTGLIFAGAMWDLRKIFIAQLGEEAGVALADRLYYGTLERAVHIPSSYVEVLAEDDDDGDLANGTPHICDINAAFGAHGLRAVEAELEPLSAELPGEAGVPISVAVSGFSPQCPGDGIESAVIVWRLRGQADDELQEIEMGEVEDGIWSAAIPASAAGQVVRFKLRLDAFDGGSFSFPRNDADPEYEFYVGEVEPIYCTSFDTDPFAEGWTHGLVSGSQLADDWVWGVPMGPESSGDPLAAFSGETVLGNDLGGEDKNGFYDSDTRNFAQTPVIDVGSHSDVRLQYRRWLTIEDGHFDRATIYANGESAWANLDSDQGDQSKTHHFDREWRFQDVPVTEFIAGGELRLRFEIDSDSGLEFGGWTIDDLCVVAGAGATCGDGATTGPETCDDGAGNSDSEPDACRTNCRIASCGDGALDTGEVCDDGNVLDGDSCAADCSVDTTRAGDCGCLAADGDGSSWGAFFLLALGALLLRRRRSVRPA